MRRWVPLALVAVLVPAGASAQERSDPLVPGEESPELAALRQMEEELFGGQPLTRIEAGPRARVSDGPSAVTSDAPAAPSPAPGRDTAWMQGLHLPDIPVRWDARVIEYLEFFRDDPRGRNFIAAWLRRVDRYGPLIRRTLREEGLPSDVLFVAMVESGFDPFVRSHAGAAGMWQFVPGTAREFGLTINHWVDMRLDPRASTVAAARYLTMLHDRFGTWELAFAAYNMGYGALLRSIRKYNTNDYWALSHMEAGLPFETNLYVSKIIACAIVAHNRERFGFGDLTMEPPVEWDTVEVPGGVSLALIARAAGAEVDTIRRLNPGYRRGRTPPGADARPINVPAGSADEFARRWARIRPQRPVNRPHVMRFGETLGDLARERGTTEARLRELNEIEDDETVGAGWVLLAPVVRESQRASRDEDDERPVVAIPPGQDAVEGRRRVFYRVPRTDRIDTVARFFHVGVEDIRRWNGIDPHARLQSGMYLQLFVDPELDLSRAVVRTPDQVRVLVVGSEEFFAHHEGQNGRARFSYRVREGDTLTSIGRRFDISVGSLARINQIARNSTLHPGDRLVVYAEERRAPAEARRESREAAAERTEAEPAEDAPEQPEAADETATETADADDADDTGSEDPTDAGADAGDTPDADEPPPGAVPEPDASEEQHPG